MRHRLWAHSRLTGGSGSATGCTTELKVVVVLVELAVQIAKHHVIRFVVHIPTAPAVALQQLLRTVVTPGGGCSGLQGCMKMLA
jgi:hypothetical protein